jgi:hypothetical protein
MFSSFFPTQEEDKKNQHNQHNQHDPPAGHGFEK